MPSRPRLQSLMALMLAAQGSVAWTGCGGSETLPAVDCTTDGACDNGNPCDGEERCVAGSCAQGSPLGDGRPCPRAAKEGTGGDAEPAGICLAAVCEESVCGDALVDTLAGEVCDDGDDADPDDGCHNCTWSCTSDADCADHNPCNGKERCAVYTHQCQAGTPLDCNDHKACTTDHCSPVSGCYYEGGDGDGDGDGWSCLADCNDGDADIHPGALERCDGTDSDCDGVTDNVTVFGSGEPSATWYADCDGDGYAAADAASLQTCPDATPAGLPDSAVCPGGPVGGGTETPAPAWIQTPPGANPDCHDDVPEAHPVGEGSPLVWHVDPIPGTEDDFDYNCDGDEQRRHSAYSDCAGSCAGGWGTWVPPCGLGGSWITCGPQGLLCVDVRGGWNIQSCR